jgi:hypothetical protein
MNFTQCILVIHNQFPCTQGTVFLPLKSAERITVFNSSRAFNSFILHCFLVLGWLSSALLCTAQHSQYRFAGLSSYVLFFFAVKFEFFFSSDCRSFALHGSSARNWKGFDWAYLGQLILPSLFFLQVNVPKWWTQISILFFTFSIPNKWSHFFAWNLMVYFAEFFDIILLFTKLWIFPSSLKNLFH